MVGYLHDGRSFITTLRALPHSARIPRVTDHTRFWWSIFSLLRRLLGTGATATHFRQASLQILARPLSHRKMAFGIYPGADLTFLSPYLKFRVAVAIHDHPAVSG